MLEDFSIKHWEIMDRMTNGIKAEHEIPKDDEVRFQLGAPLFAITFQIRDGKLHYKAEGPIVFQPEACNAGQITLSMKTGEVNTTEISWENHLKWMEAHKDDKRYW